MASTPRPPPTSPFKRKKICLVKHNYIRRLESERGCFTRPKRKCVQTYVTMVSDNSCILSYWYLEILSSCSTDIPGHTGAIPALGNKGWTVNLCLQVLLHPSRTWASRISTPNSRSTPFSLLSSCNHTYCDLHAITAEDVHQLTTHPLIFLRLQPLGASLLRFFKIHQKESPPSSKHLFTLFFFFLFFCFSRGQSNFIYLIFLNTSYEG